MPGPILWGPNQVATNLENSILQANGSILQYNGPVNYIGYNNFENGLTTGWSLGTTGTLTNAIPTGSPTFGSGAAGTLAISAVSSGQLSNNYSLNYADSAATTAGNMVASDPLAIDLAGQAKVLTFVFNYKAVTNVANMNFSGTSSNSFGVAVWDVTNSVWLTLAGNFAMVQSSGVGVATGTCQTNATTASIRFVVYNATASAGACSIYLDNFYLGPQTAPIGMPATDWVNAGANVISAVTTAPVQTGNTKTIDALWWRRVGGNAEIRIEFKQTAAGTNTAGSGDYLFTMPTTIPAIDTNKLTVYGGTSIGENTASPQSSNSVGSGVVTSTNLIGKAVSVMVYDSTHVRLAGPDSSTGGGAGQGAVGSTFAQLSNAAVSYAVSFSVPISGWSANVQMSPDTNTRVVSMIANGTIPQPIANSPLIYPTTLQDTHAAYNTTTGRYTVPVSGTYRMSFSILAAFANTNTAFNIYKNGSIGDTIGWSYNNAVSGSGKIICVAGDIIDVRPASVQTATGVGQLSIELISGPATIAATESVNLIVNTSTTAATTSAPFKFTVTTRDSHNAYSASTGQYTVPVSGVYLVISGVAQSNTANFMSIRKNGTIIMNGTNYSGVTSVDLAVSGMLLCNAGDTIDVVPGANATATGTAVGNYLNIARIGN